MRKTAVLLAAAIVAGASLGLGAKSAVAADTQEFKIGWVLPLTGPVAELAKSYADGAEVALAMINASGGIGGLQARMIMCDSQSQEQQAVICAKKLINEDQVNLMLGATGTPPTLAIIPTIESVGMPLFALAAGGPPRGPQQKRGV